MAPLVILSAAKNSFETDSSNCCCRRKVRKLEDYRLIPGRAFELNMLSQITDTKSGSILRDRFTFGADCAQGRLSPTTTYCKK